MGFSTGSIIGQVAGIASRIRAKATTPNHRGEAIASADLSRVQRFQAAAVESSGHAFIITDLDGTITAWNRSAERLFALPASEVVGRHVSLIVPRDRHNEISSIL